MLPRLVELNELSQSQNVVRTEQVRNAVDMYEDAMLDRAFIWVKKSGGIDVPVSLNKTPPNIRAFD